MLLSTSNKRALDRNMPDGKITRRKTVGGNVVCRARDPRSDSRSEQPPESDAVFARARAAVADFRFYNFGAGLESAGTSMARHFILDRLHLAHFYGSVARPLDLLVLRLEARRAERALRE